MDSSELKEIDIQIQALKKSAEALSRLGEDFPAVARNSVRILASIKMLEINVSDLLELDA
jgi:hypothetical protein